MASEESNTLETEPTPVPPSTIFCADDADVVIRAAGSRDLRAHKLILSLVSPILKDMFSIPQPPTDAPGILPHVDVVESAETWEHILQTIYPMPHPIINDLNHLESLRLAAKKYEMQAIIDIHKKGLENRASIREDPLRLFAIACTCGLEYQAKYVARNAELTMITRRFDPKDPKGVTLDSYHNLVSFLIERDIEWRQTLSSAPTPYNSWCSCKAALKENLYNKIKQGVKGPCIQTGEAYLMALEKRSRDHELGCVRSDCSVGDWEIKRFVERVAKEGEELCDRLMRE